jgi:uncharacterized protein (TIGR02594 family)
MPEIQYWFSGAAIFLLFSFAITVIIGVIPMIDGKKRIIIFVLLGAGFVVAVLGWWVAAKQEEKSDHQAGQLTATQDSLKTMGDQLADVIVAMNRLLGLMPGSQPADIAILAPTTPEWVRVAYKELGQKEISGLQENPHIVEYFKTIGAKENYRDDVDDWASAFAEWSLNQVGIKGPKSDEPFSWLEWGQDLAKPVIGCIVVMSFSGLHHVGFYFGEDDDFMQILGGNEDDAVHIFRYPKSAVFGYRWPSNMKVPDIH